MAMPIFPAATGGGAHGHSVLPVPFLDPFGQSLAGRGPIVRSRLRTGGGGIRGDFVGRGAGAGLAGTVLQIEVKPKKQSHPWVALFSFVNIPPASPAVLPPPRRLATCLRRRPCGEDLRERTRHTYRREASLRSAPESRNQCHRSRRSPPDGR